MTARPYRTYRADRRNAARAHAAKEWLKLRDVWHRFTLVFNAFQPKQGRRHDRHRATWRLKELKTALRDFDAHRKQWK